MATADQNFRSNYYGQIGIVHPNGQDLKSLDQLLAKSPVDVSKLQILCQRVSLPTSHRDRVWKLILGLLPGDESLNEEFETDQRESFEDLERALRTLRFIDSQSDATHALTLMFLLEQGQLSSKWRQQLKEESMRDFQAIAHIFFESKISRCDAFWLSRNFWLFWRRLNANVGDLIKQTEALLRENHMEFYERLKANGDSLPIAHWFRRCFAGVLPVPELFHVWDRILSGSTKHLPMVARGVLLQLKSSLLNSEGNAMCLEAYDTPLSGELAMQVVTQAGL